MHEFSIAEGLIKILDDELKKHSLEKVIKINLKIGVLKAVVPDSLTFAFNILSKGTKYENAEFGITSIPIKTHCPKCGTESDYKNTFKYILFCKKCRNPNIEIISGNEFYIDSIEGE